MEGKTQIKICVGSSCFVKGNKNNLDFLDEYLKKNNLKADVSFKGQLCTKQCDKGPVVIIDGKTYTHVSKSVLINLLKEKFRYKMHQSEYFVNAEERGE